MLVVVTMPYDDTQWKSQWKQLSLHLACEWLETFQNYAYEYVCLLFTILSVKRGYEKFKFHLSAIPWSALRPITMIDDLSKTKSIDFRKRQMLFVGFEYTEYSIKQNKIKIAKYLSNHSIDTFKHMFENDWRFRVKQTFIRLFGCPYVNIAYTVDP